MKAQAMAIGRVTSYRREKSRLSVQHSYLQLIETLEQRLLLSSITVNSLADNLTSGDGLVTLREAIIAANTDSATDLGETGSGADQIVFSVNGTITFNLSGAEDDTTAVPETGDLDILEELTITGDGPALTIIDAAGLDRVFEVAAGVTVTLDGLKIIGGSGSEGGGVRNLGNLTINNSEIVGNESTGQAPSGSEFDIDVRFIDSTLTPSQQAIFSTAAARWEQIIIGDVPDVFIDGIGIVDDVVIDASAPAIDGPGGILGQAGPELIRTDSFLPAKGIMQFDSADLAELEADGQLLEVILHEMGHVLGFGTIWDLLGLIRGAGGGNPQFLGTGAIAEYNSIFGLTKTSVPLANTGGAGTRDSHWRETTFENELMSGFLDGGVINPLSRISAASMGDLGYVVDVDAADDYTPPAVVASVSSNFRARAVSGRLVTLDIEPRFVTPVNNRPGTAGRAPMRSQSTDDTEPVSTVMSISGFADGGGVFNSGTLNLNGVVIDSNNAIGRGGGIANTGTLTVLDSVIANNTAGADGGGIASNGTLAITTSTISGNQASNAGGGVSLESSATITASTISENIADVGGGINNAGTLTIDASTISGNQAIGQVVVPPSEYDVEVVFVDSTLSPSQQAIFTTAAARWEQIIIGDVPDVFVAGFGTVDDVAIDASAPDIDGPGGILGQAGPTAVRTSSRLPARGIMQFDAADLANLEASGQLLDVILHEMGHVLGFGSIWDDSNLGLLIGAGTSDPRFTGPAATTEYNAIFGVAESSVPVANTGGAGTRDSHWRESVFDNELMTGFLNGSVVNPISRISVAAMSDMGYEVNINAADPYSPPSTLLSLSADMSAAQVTGRLVTLDMEPILVGPANNQPVSVNTPTTISQEDVTVGSVVGSMVIDGLGDGGGLFNDGTVAMINVTVSGNAATATGGGIANIGTFTAVNTSITKNLAATDGGAGPSGAGLATDIGVATLHNTIVAANITGTGNFQVNDDIAGGVDSSSSFNLIGVDTGLTGITNATNGNQIGTSTTPINPHLAPLADNGGPTQTHLPLLASTAIDQGGGVTGFPSSDQRGLTRPVNHAPAPDSLATGANGSDIGAVELQLNEEPFAPRVAEVLVASTNWLAAFFDQLSTDGVGDDAGYRIPSGTSQLDNLAWDTLDKVSIRFDQAIQMPAIDDLIISGVGAPMPVSVAYDSTNFTATWTLDAAIPDGAMSINLSGNVMDTDGNSVDGEFIDTDSLPSGDLTPGGGFSFTVNVKAGDFNNDDITDAVDIDTLAAGIRGDIPYDVRLDLTGDALLDFVGDTTHLVEQILGTRFGDIDLDQKVSISDLSTLALFFGATGIGWASGDFNGDTTSSVADLSLQALNFGFDGTADTSTATITADLTADGTVDAHDIDSVSDALRTGSDDVIFDLNGDDSVDVLDRDYLVRDVLDTNYGDVNLDGHVDRRDYQIMRQNYRLTDAGWEDGDITGDGVVDFSDLRQYTISRRYGHITRPVYVVPLDVSHTSKRSKSPSSLRLVMLEDPDQLGI